MRVVIEVPGWQAVCFSAPVVETYRAGEFTRHPVVGSLGPDLCKEDASIAECVERMARYCEAERTVAEALLDQRVACGVGNVYKSEVLWACELHPFTPVGALDNEQRAKLIEKAAELLRANLDTPTRVTASGSPEGLAVYGRFGKPCLRCSTPIEVRKHGQQARVTYWCPSCQIYLPLPEPDPNEVASPPDTSSRRFSWRRKTRRGADVDHGEGDAPADRTDAVDVETGMIVDDRMDVDRAYEDSRHTPAYARSEAQRLERRVTQPAAQAQAQAYLARRGLPSIPSGFDPLLARDS